MELKRVLTLALSLAALAAMLAGCGGSASSASESTAPQSEAASAASVASAASSAPAERAPASDSSAPDSSAPADSSLPEEPVSEPGPWADEVLVGHLVIDGVTFKLEEIEESRQTVPEGMPEDHEAFFVRLILTGSGDMAAAAERLKGEGYLLAPDGAQYTAGFMSTQITPSKGTCGLLVGVPKGTDVGRELVLVFGDKKMALS